MKTAEDANDADIFEFFFAKNLRALGVVRG
jgi:hypothetical protein